MLCYYLTLEGHSLTHAYTCSANEGLTRMVLIYNEPDWRLLNQDLSHCMLTRAEIETQSQSSWLAGTQAMGAMPIAQVMEAAMHNINEAYFLGWPTGQETTFEKRSISSTKNISQLSHSP